MRTFSTFLVSLIVAFSVPVHALTGKGDAVAFKEQIIDLAQDQNTDRYYSVLRDKTALLTIEQILSGQISEEEWQHYSGNVSRGVVPEPTWMRFVITNSDPAQSKYMLEHTDPGPMSIDLFVIAPDGTIESEQHYHREKPFFTRPYPNPVAVFPLEVKTGDKRLVYARINTSMGGMFTQFAVWTPERFIAYELRETALYGAAYMSFLIFSFLSLIAFFALKEKTFLSYSALTLVSCLSLMNLESHWIPFFQWDGGPMNGAIIWTGMYVMLALTFARQYLNLAQVMPWAVKLTYAGTALGPFIVVLGLLGEFETAGLFMMASMLVIMTIPFLSLYLWLAKGQKVRLFTCAWLIYCCAVSVQFAFRQVGLVPHIPLTIYSGTYGGVIEMFLLSASMGLKVLDLRRERDTVRETYLKNLETFSHHLEQEVERKTKELHEAKTQAEQEARTDSLTKLLNRRALQEIAPHIIANAKRDNMYVSTILIDIDFFKNVNDVNGHAAGDEILIQIAKTLSATTREGDLLARIGGEEFVILARSETQEGAVSFCDRARQAIEEKDIRINEETTLSVTISIGLYTSLNGTDLSDALQKADLALYNSKENGRNRVTLWTEALEGAEC